MTARTMLLAIALTAAFSALTTCTSAEKNPKASAEPRPASASTAAPTATVAPSNGASNLNFESPQPADKTWPSGWSGGGEGYDLSVDTQSPHSGRAAGHIARRAGPAPGEHAFASLTQCIEPSDWRGKRVRLRGWVRTEAAQSAGLWMRVDGPQGKSLAFDNMGPRRLSGTTGWTECQVVLDVPPEAVRVCFGMLLAGGGRAWADDFLFEFVGTDTPVTNSLGDR